MDYIFKYVIFIVFFHSFPLQFPFTKKSLSQSLILTLRHTLTLQYPMENTANMKLSVKELANLSGVTVRTLHLYDQIGLLTPPIRTEARYRWYGEKELLRLQQILFYRELGLPLKEITEILDDPGFDIIQALESHQRELKSKKKKISEMLKTIEITMLNLKEKKMSNHEELYKGLRPEEAKSLRENAVEKYGDEAVQTAENYLGKLSKEEIQRLKSEQQEIIRKLADLVAEKPDSPSVQVEIARHYKNIRQFWGTHESHDPQLEAYKGLGELYVSDESFIQTEGKPNPLLARFMRDAIAYLADEKLK